ncbi:MAG: ATP-binding cassette domain-containing protein, partial [bacterium]
MAEALWQLEGVRLGKAPVRLDDVTVTIPPGVTAILGASGAGKTSLLNLLVRYERPDQGAVVATVAKGPHALPVYWAPQTAGLWPHLTVQEHVEAVAPRGADPDAATALLEALDVAHRAEARPDELSEGERSRVAVARALAADAAALVMDEPFASVDVARVGRYWAVVRERLAASGASLVFATHRPEAVLAEAERVVCLREGRLIYEGTVADLYWRPRSPEEAACLGEANWLSPDEARTWLGRELDAPRCYRPEQLAVAETDGGPLVVEASRFKGAVAEVELVHEPSGRRRRFVHRPSTNHLRAGARVVVRVLAALLLTVLV